MEKKKTAPVSKKMILISSFHSGFSKSRCTHINLVKAETIVNVIAVIKI